MLCVAVGCDKKAAPSYFMCFYHWAWVPVKIQKAVFKTFKLGQDYPTMSSDMPWNGAMQEAVNAVSLLEKRPIPFSLDDDDFELELAEFPVEDEEELELA